MNWKGKKYRKKLRDGNELIKGGKARNERGINDKGNKRRTKDKKHKGRGNCNVLDKKNKGK